MFLWLCHVPLIFFFFEFLKLLHCCLCISRNNHLLQSLLTDFRREIPSPVSLARPSYVASDIFYGCTYFTFLVPPWGEFLNLYASFTLAKEDCMVSSLFCLRWYPEMLEFVCFLLILQNRAGLLCFFCKLSVKAHTGHEKLIKVGWVRYTQHRSCSWTI